MVNGEGKECFGKMFTISAYECENKIHNIEFWADWFDALINLIDMKAHGQLHIEKFGEGELHGISAFQFIETSSITLHTEKRNNGIHLDVFSCKDFDEHKIFDFLYKTLKCNLKKAHFKIIYR